MNKWLLFSLFLVGCSDNPGYFIMDNNAGHPVFGCEHVYVGSDGITGRECYDMLCDTTVLKVEFVHLKDSIVTKSEKPIEKPECAK